MVVKRPPANGSRLAANWAVWNGPKQPSNADSDRHLVSDHTFKPKFEGVTRAFKLAEVIVDDPRGR